MKNTFSEYHPILNFIFYIGAIVLGVLQYHPAYLLVSAVCSLAYLVTVKGRRCGGSLGLAAGLWLLTTLINPFVNKRGDTVLFTYFGGRPFTLEALLYGMAIATMVASVLMWFATYNEVITSDKFVYLFGSRMPALSLVFTMVLRLVPNYQKKVRQITCARMCVGKSASDGTIREKTESAGSVLAVMTGWALEDAVMKGDSMRSRGYGTGDRTRYSIYRFSRRDKILLVVMLLLIAGTLSGLIRGTGSYAYIPKIELAPANTPKAIISLVSYTLFLAIPTILNLVEVIRWDILKSKI